MVAVELSADETTVTLTLDPTTLQRENTDYTVLFLGVTDLAGNAMPDGTTIAFHSYVTYECAGLLLEMYNTGGGTVVADLTNNAVFPNNPDEVRLLNSFDTRAELGTDNYRDTYGARLSGLFVPSVTGPYVFYSHSDDSAQLFLNPNGIDPAGRVLIAHEDGCCNDWPTINSLGLFPNGIPLQAGKAY